MTRAVGAIVKREYLQRVRSRWFVIATIAGPILFGGIAVLPIVLSDAPTSDRLVVIDRTGELAGAMAPALTGIGYQVERVDADADLADFIQAVHDEEVFGVLVLDSATLRRGAARLVVGSAISPMREVALRQIVGQGAIATRLRDEGPELLALLGGGVLEVDRLDRGTEVESADFALAYFGAFLLYITLLFYAVAVMRSVLEEKTSRVIEIIISSVRPIELMLGKIVGVGAVGLTQLGIWAVSLVVLAKLGLPRLTAARPELEILGELGSVVPGVGHLALFLAFFLGGYFLYSGLYAAVGAMTNSDQEAQQAQAPLVVLMVVPAVILPGVIQNPDSVLSLWTSQVPFFAPVLMFARAVSGAASPLEIGASLVGIGLTTVGVAWVGGRIYRVGILMTGKRPSLREVWRWVRVG
ncbi:MAG: ABC transporter permease [Longimicrobiales bacterium]|nr:ABC transporter permease [Longimicrobiales bacterium]